MMMAILFGSQLSGKFKQIHSILIAMQKQMQINQKEAAKFLKLNSPSLKAIKIRIMIKFQIIHRIKAKTLKLKLRIRVKSKENK